MTLNKLLVKESAILGKNRVKISMNRKMMEIMAKYQVTPMDLLEGRVTPSFRKYLRITQDLRSQEYTYEWAMNDMAGFYGDDLPANENSDNRVYIEGDNNHDNLVLGYALCRSIACSLVDMKDRFHVFMNFSDDGEYDCVKVSFYCRRQSYPDVLSSLETYVNEGIVLFDIL